MNLFVLGRLSIMSLQPAGSCLDLSIGCCLILIVINRLFVFLLVRVCYYALLSIHIVRWCHWLVALLQEANWADAEVDYFVICNVRQIFVLHTESLTSLILRWCRLKSTRQEPAIAENGMLGWHRRAGHFSIPTCLLWSLNGPTSHRSVALAVETLRICDALSTRSVGISLGRFPLIHGLQWLRSRTLLLRVICGWVRAWRVSLLMM